MKGLNTKGMDALRKALKQAKSTQVKVGIMGSSAVRGAGKSADTLTNAQVGALHEFGDSSHPRRSWLRDPITERFYKRLTSSGTLSKAMIVKMVKQRSFLLYFERMGILGVSIIQEGFQSGGFGAWKPSNMARKKVAMTLVETGQLRESVSYEVGKV